MSKKLPGNVESAAVKSAGRRTKEVYSTVQEEPLEFGASYFPPQTELHGFEHSKPGAKKLPPDSLGYAFVVAAHAVRQVRSGRALNDGLMSLWRQYPDLPVQQRSLVRDLIWGCLEDYGHPEVILAQLLHQKLSHPHIEALLWVALHRINTHLPSAHTIVDQAVEATAYLSPGTFKGLVNAVLRNALRQWDLLQKKVKQHPPARYCHPQWWIDMVRDAYPKEWENVLAINQTPAPLTLRINPRRTTTADTIHQLQNANLSVRMLGNFAVRIEHAVPTAAIPGFSEGHVSVQDWGAQQAAKLLDVHDELRVLDACAAPGGKTAHILELAQVALTALDNQPKRVANISANLERLGLYADVRHADCTQLDDWWDGVPFDRILADVPCSGSGIVRRHPDIKYLRRKEDIAAFARTQREILEALWPTLARGGKLLYVTCSIFPPENEGQITAFVAHHHDCQRIPMENGGVSQQWLPSVDHDGFFFALLQKT